MLWRCWLGGRKGIRPVKNEWWVAGMVICLEQGADLHTAQLMPLPLTVFCFSKIQIGFTFLVLAHPGSPGKRAVKRACVCVFYMVSWVSVSQWTVPVTVWCRTAVRTPLVTVTPRVRRLQHPRLWPATWRYVATQRPVERDWHQPWQSAAAAAWRHLMVHELASVAIFALLSLDNNSIVSPV